VTFCAATPPHPWARRELPLSPLCRSAWIAEQQELAGEVREFRRVGGRFDFSALLDITKLIEKSRISGAVLETTISAMLCCSSTAPPSGVRLRCILPPTLRTDWRRTRALSGNSTRLHQFLRFFRNKIQPDGTLEDRASPELARIRRDIEKQRREIQQSLRGYLRKLAEAAPCRTN